MTSIELEKMGEFLKSCIAEAGKELVPAGTRRERWLLAKALMRVRWRIPLTPEEDAFVSSATQTAVRITLHEPEPPARTGLADPPRWTAGFDKSALIPELEKERALREEALTEARHENGVLLARAEEAEAARDRFGARVAQAIRDRDETRGERLAALAQVSALEAKVAEEKAERIEALEKAAHRERQLSEAWRKLAAAEAKVKAMENGIERYASWLEHGAEESERAAKEYKRAHGLDSSMAEWQELKAAQYRGIVTNLRALASSPTGETAP